MYPVVGQCPVCGEDLAVTRLHCSSCDTAIEGRFGLGPLFRLSPAQWAFAELFIRCEGKLNKVGEVLDVSYPTVRAQLDDLILTLGGYVPAEAEDEAQALEAEAALAQEEERRRILDALSAGEMTSDEALAQLSSFMKM